MSVDDKIVNVKCLKAGLDTKCSVHRFTATIPTTGWAEYQSSGIYYVTVSTSGILSTDKLVMDLVQSGTESTDRQLRSMYDKFCRLTSGSNSFTLYAEKVPTIAVPVSVEVLR